MTTEETIAEDATGCCAGSRGDLRMYAGGRNVNGHVDSGGYPFDSLEDAQDYLFQRGSIAVPDAGAGSYRKVFETLGFTQVEVFEQSSSAGYWSFIVCDGDYWMLAFQENRYPYHGFNYSVDFDWQFGTKEECLKFACDRCT